ncbi:hypothetical protein RI138_31675 [Streptomyces sp. C11-1]|uniref:Transposase n=1 Tax=Streptomyces durocortorensis TaxID=2811104 RepID=A0ABY9W5C9_9ACTN|nr:hypothetical protein [Streptomyces durocortorensis]WNF31035.1 hypothetical protein RI138_31675 [Streptomyces durocortorensis]
MTTRLHLAVEQCQEPMPIVITAGQRGNSPQFERVLERIRVPRQGLGRPRERLDKVRAC